MRLGCIADDFTGSSDLGLMLAEGGMRAIQYVGTPDEPADAAVDAGIVALKSRSIPAAEAVAQSLDACRWLVAQGCSTILFKYCSTFDSTPKGNIGPVIDALVEELDTDDPVIVCPAFPETGRTIYMGHLFVNGRLLSESGMEHHPLNPMTDPNLARWLSLQTRRAVGRLTYADLDDPDAAFAREREAGRQIVVCDAVEDDHLITLGHAATHHRLVTGGSGIALGLPAAMGFRPEGRAAWRGVDGPYLALAGSCSQATLAQIEAHAAAGHAVRRIGAEAILDGAADPVRAVEEALEGGTLPLIASSDTPEAVAELQKRRGRETVAQAVEAFFARAARAALAAGVTRLVSAGGETSGAIVSALDVRSLEIGARIAAGVPAVRIAGTDVAMALKSGNFGATTFFADAADVLSRDHGARAV